MKVAIPLGSEITKVENRAIRIKVKNTLFWLQGEQQTDKTWILYLVDPLTSYKKLIGKKYKTKDFATFSGVVLNTPFPFIGKKAENSKVVKKFINKLIKTKKIYARKCKSNIGKQSSKLQTNRKRFIKNESNKSSPNNSINVRKRS